MGIAGRGLSNVCIPITCDADLGRLSAGLHIVRKKGRILSWRIERTRLWGTSGTSMFAFSSQMLALSLYRSFGNGWALPRGCRAELESDNVNIASGLITSQQSKVGVALKISHTFKFSAKLVLILGTL